MTVCISWPNFLNSQSVIQKISSKMNFNPFTNTDHAATYFEVYGMVKNIKNWIYQERNMTFPYNKKILVLCLKTYFQRFTLFRGGKLQCQCTHFEKIVTKSVTKHEDIRKVLKCRYWFYICFYFFVTNDSKFSAKH